VIPPQQGGLTDARACKNTHKYDGFWAAECYCGQRLINKRSENGVTRRQWCQNSANKMIIGSGTPSSQSKAPRPKPISGLLFNVKI
jgi:hypothetical protein